MPEVAELQVTSVKSLLLLLVVTVLVMLVGEEVSNTSASPTNRKQSVFLGTSSPTPRVTPPAAFSPDPLFWGGAPRLAECSAQWQDAAAEYAAFHSAVLEGLKVQVATAPPGTPLNLSVPVLVYYCSESQRPSCGGWGDRVTGLSSIFYLALRMRVLFFIAGLESSLSTSVEPAMFDWRYDINAAVLKRFISPRDRYFKEIDCTDCFHSADFNYTWNAPRFRFAPLLGAFTTISVNRGWVARSTAPSHVARIHEVGLTLGTWGCLYRALLQPTTGLRASMTADLAAMKAAPFSVCTHHRSGDHTLKTQIASAAESSKLVASFAPAAACVVRAVQVVSGVQPNHSLNGLSTHANLRPEKVLVLFVSDSVRLKEAAPAVFASAGMAGLTVRTMPVIPYHVDHDAGGDPAMVLTARVFDTMREWFTLTQCTVWAGSVQSGFCRTALVVSMSNHTMTSTPQFTRGAACAGFMGSDQFWTATTENGKNSAGM